MPHINSDEIPAQLTRVGRYEQKTIITVSLTGHLNSYIVAMMIGAFLRCLHMRFLQSLVMWI